MLTKDYYVYILTNKWNTVLYTGHTNNLVRRTFEHQNGFVDSFTKRYNTHKLVYYEVTQDAFSAIEREKKIKKLSRANKIKLITKFNPEWKDLWNDIIQ